MYPTLINPIPSINFLANITQYYGEHPEIYKPLGLAFHEGIDIYARLGTPVVCMLGGELVEATAKETGYGLRISIFSEYAPGKALLITYGHFQSIPFKSSPWKSPTFSYGWIGTGQHIGNVDSTGFSTGNHLHITVQPYHLASNKWQKTFPNNGVSGAINPLPLIQANAMARLYIDRRTNPPTIIVGDRVDTPDNLQWLAEQHGIVVPKKADGTVDFDKVAYDGEIK